MPSLSVPVVPVPVVDVAGRRSQRPVEEDDAEEVAVAEEAPAAALP